MYSSQAIAAKNANVYASFDAIWSEAGVIVAGNSAETDPSGLIVMGAGALMPFKITDERGLWLMGGQNCTTAKDFSADAPFSIAILTDCPITAAGWLAATFDSSINRGVRFGASAAGTLVATLQNAGGSIVQTAVAAVNPSREKRLYVLTYDGSGFSSGLKIHVDGVTCTSVGSGTTVAGSLSSGRALSFGSQWNGAAPSTFALGRLYAVAVYPFVLDSAMRSMLREKMRQDVHAEYPASYAQVPAWTPVSLPQPGNSWLWMDLDAAGAVVRHTQPIILNTGFDDTSAWSFTGTGWAIGSGVATHSSGVGTGSVIQNVFIQGCRYSYDWQLVSISTGSIRPYVGLGTPLTPIAVAGSYTAEGTCLIDNYIYFYSDITSDAVIDNCGTNAENLSVNRVNCAGNLGSLEQTTPTIMGWESSRGIQFAVGDLMSVSGLGLFNFLHTASDATLVIGFRISTLNTYNALWGTASGTLGTNVGAMAFIYNNRIHYRVQDGLGGILNVSTAAAVVFANVNYVATFRKTATTYDIRLNSSEVLAGALAGTSNLNHSLNFTLSGWGAVTPHNLDGECRELFTIDRRITDTEAALIEAQILAKMAP